MIKKTVDRIFVEKDFRNYLTTLPIMDKNKIPYTNYGYKIHLSYVTHSGEAHLEDLVLELVNRKIYLMEISKIDFCQAEEQYGKIFGTLFLGLVNYYINIYRFSEDKFYSFTRYDHLVLLRIIKLNFKNTANYMVLRLFKVDESKNFYYNFRKIFQLPKIIKERESIEKDFRMCLISIPVVKKKKFRLMIMNTIKPINPT